MNLKPEELSQEVYELWVRDSNGSYEFWYMSTELRSMKQVKNARIYRRTWVSLGKRSRWEFD